MEQVSRQRLIFILIVAIFTAPVVAAWLLYVGGGSLLPKGASNHGTLVEPVRLLETQGLGSPAGEPLQADFFRGKWTLLVFERDQCDETCERNLYNTRQVRLALNKDIDRVQRLLVRRPVEHGPAASGYGQVHPDLVVAVDRSGRFAEQLSDLLEGDRQGRLFLVDPLGNLMMFYEQGDSPKGMLSDLRHLLRISGIG